MLKKLTLVPVFTVIFSQSLWAAPTADSQPAEKAEAAKVVEDRQAVASLEKKLNAIHTLSARFQQDAISADGRVASESGVMQMKRPGRFRWLTEKPYEQEIVARDDKVWMIDRDLQQVIIQKQDERMANTPAQLLSGKAGDLLKQYRVAVYKTKTSEKYTLTPSGQSDLFEKLDITFKEGALDTMELRDALGGRRRISFSDVNKNGMISNSRFRVNIPKGFDVIDESGS